VSESGETQRVPGAGPAVVGGGRLVYLEAGRGIASIVVLLHHLVLAFKPSLDAAFPRGVQFTPLYGAINGSAAVAFFFALSGFVLSRSLIQSPSRGRLATSVIKRLPRLALPVVVTLMAGCLILMAGYHHYVTTAHLTGSWWLETFGNAKFPDKFVPSFLDAMRNSILIFIQGGKFYYNSNLWTMRSEYLCSLAVLLAAYVVGRFIGRKLICLAAILGVTAVLIVSNTQLAFADFGVGMALAIVYSSWRIVLNPLLGALAIAAAICLLAAEDARLATIAAGLLLFVMMTSPNIERALSGPVGYWLGRGSFPLYLVHTLVIVTIGSEVYAAMFAKAHVYWLSMAVTSLAVVAVSVAVAMPLMWLDEWWVPTLNRAVSRVMEPMRRMVRRTA